MRIIRYTLFSFILLTSIVSKTIEENSRTEVDNTNQQSSTKSDLSLSRTGLWRPVQAMVRNTVVQVFSMIAEFDWLQPYRTPNQHVGRASGFFINDQGDIITNAHVVDQAVSIWIHIPSLGKRPLKAEIVGVCPERDIALLRIAEQDVHIIREVLGTIPYLQLGDSDMVYRADDVIVIGYPLGQETLKSTTGVISGREHHFFQTSAATNPGSSGAPLLNSEGLVIGIHTAGIDMAQNVGYAIPVNILKVVLPDLYNVSLLRKPFLGLLSIMVTDEVTKYLYNPVPGGCYVVEVVKNSPLENAGVQSGDMIYEINGQRLDIYGEMSVSWCEDRISFADYISRLALGQQVNLVVYRNGERIEMVVDFDQTDVVPIRKMYPWHEEIDYEVFAGMVVMSLTINHIRILAEQAPGLKLYAGLSEQTEPLLIITHIFPDSELAQTQTVAAGFTLTELNGISVRTLEEFRAALTKSVETGCVVIKTTDQISRASDNILAVLPFDSVCTEVVQLSQRYHYPITETVQALLKEEARD